MVRRFGVTDGDLRIAQVNAGVEHGRDWRMAEDHKGTEAASLTVIMP